MTAKQIELEVTRGNNIVGTCQSQGVESEDPLKSERSNEAHGSLVVIVQK